MPTPFVHLPIALEVARRLPRQGPVIDEPAFLFGSVAPDIAHQLDLPRDVTHFWTTRDDVSGALHLLARYPDLRADRLAPAERNFIAGYLSHLVADEQWTFCLWRPYFGRHSPYGGGPEGAALQSAYRDALDVEAAAASPTSADFAEQLRAAAAVRLRDGLLPFLPSAALHRGREAVLEQCRLPPGEARARYWHTLKGRDEASAAATVSTPERRAQAMAYVRRESLQEFRARSVEEGVALVRDYLAGSPLKPPRGTQDPRTLGRPAAVASEVVAATEVATAP
jgi:hypothetical protein